MTRPDAVDLTARSATLLEWPALLAHLAARAVTPAGKEACLRVESSSDAAVVADRYAEVQEWLTMYARRGDLPLAAGSDPRPALHAAIEGGMLDGAHCREIALVLQQAADVRRALADASSDAPQPYLTAYAQQLDDLPELRWAIGQTIDAQGNLRESATPELQRLRHEVDRLRRAITERVEGLLRSPDFEPWLQDAYVTQREDRYVLPIKIEHRTKVRGIVHDLSSSGQTVFIEPEDLVEANNELKWAELALGEEIERIFRRLTDQIAASRALVAVDCAVLTRLDMIQAKGRLGLAYQGTIPALIAEGTIAWRGLRHPLLALRGATAVPNDVVIDEGTRAVVISGPNMGGKTVLLKAIGLAAFMTRAALPLACHEGTATPIFREVMMDVGDDQDLGRDLSTFAGHIRIVANMLEAAAPGGLVLIDELATATDPDEGAALAQASLEAFLAQGVLAIVTTHYAALKAWGADGLGRTSAAMGYDVDALAPTFQLMMGRPGRSLGLEVAARLGLPPSVLARAKEVVAPHAASLERAIAALETERHAAAEAGTRLKTLADATREAALRQDAAAAALEQELASLAAARRETIAAEVARATEQIDRLIVLARQEKDPQALRTIRRRAESIVPPNDPPDADSSAPSRAPKATLFEAGARVRVTSLGSDGILLDGTRGRRRVRVRIGEREVVVAPSALAPPESADAPATPLDPTPGRATSPPLVMNETLNLLGLRVDEALTRVDRALDEAMAGGGTRLRLFHGHGTGRLKTAIRAYLRSSPYVASHHPGDLPEGGDAVTIVTLATGDIGSRS